MLTECLQGTRVLDLSQYIPGPFATLLMADFGAQVVKIEPPQGDPMRAFGPRDADGLSPFYKVLNRNKTVVRMDLKSPEGKAQLRDMIAAADVVLESFRPGVMERLGFGPAALREINPGLVHCALSGFGQTGPHAFRAGHDMTYLSLTGGLAVNGPAAAPSIVFPPLADHAGAMHAVMAILAALVRKTRTGKGVTLDVSLFESALHIGYLGLTLGLRGGLSRETDLLNGGAAYYRIYQCADGRFAALAPIEEKFWRSFCLAVDRPDWITRQGEPVPQTDLTAEVAALFATRPLAEWETVLQPADCCFEPVLEPAEVGAHPQVKARGLVHVQGGSEPLADILFPAYADGAPPPPRRPHTESEAAGILAAWANASER